MLEADADFVESQVQTAQNLARSDVFGALRITDTMLKNLPLKECDMTRVQQAHKCFEVGLWMQINSTGGCDGFYYNCYFSLSSSSVSLFSPGAPAKRPQMKNKQRSPLRIPPQIQKIATFCKKAPSSNLFQNSKNVAIEQERTKSMYTCQINAEYSRTSPMPANVLLPLITIH